MFSNKAKAAIVTAIAIPATVFGTVAGYSYVTAHGANVNDATGQDATQKATAHTVTVSIGTVGQLLPGSYADAVVTVTNANPFGVTAGNLVYSISPTGACAAGDLSVGFSPAVPGQSAIIGTLAKVSDPAHVTTRTLRISLVENTSDACIDAAQTLSASVS